LVSHVGYSPKVKENVSLKYFLAIWGQRSPFSSSKHIQLSEIAYNVQMCDGCDLRKVGDLYSDFLLRAMKDGMSMKG